MEKEWLRWGFEKYSFKLIEGYLVCLDIEQYYNTKNTNYSISSQRVSHSGENARGVPSFQFFCFPKRLTVQMHFIWHAVDILVERSSFCHFLDASLIL